MQLKCRRNIQKQTHCYYASLVKNDNGSKNMFLKDLPMQMKISDIFRDANYWNFKMRDQTEYYINKYIVCFSLDITIYKLFITRQ